MNVQGRRRRFVHYRFSLALRPEAGQSAIQRCCSLLERGGRGNGAFPCDIAQQQRRGASPRAYQLQVHAGLRPVWPRPPCNAGDQPHLASPRRLRDNRGSSHPGAHSRTSP
jgi:hypothetical protein